MTTAITPNAGNHENLSGLQSRFVGVDDLPWESTDVEGVETKTLLFEKSSGLLTVIMRMAPGVALPDHSHMKIEQTFGYRKSCRLKTFTPKSCTTVCLH